GRRHPGELALPTSCNLRISLSYAPGNNLGNFQPIGHPAGGHLALRERSDTRTKQIERVTFRCSLRYVLLYKLFIVTFVIVQFSVVDGPLAENGSGLLMR
ncbi:MAG: hypothetical protein OWQ59_09765, partial [Alicyclobacillaceae bacterium]|nr:hypothetical protein [Alicyclobacillaceae bacterium]